MSQNISLDKVLKTTASKQHVERKIINFGENKDAQELLKKLGLLDHYPQKLQLKDALCLQSKPLELSLMQTSQDGQDASNPAMDEKVVDEFTTNLRSVVMQKLMACDHRCRSDLVPRKPESSEDFDDFDDDDSSDGIHPIDTLLALILCSDDILRQDLYSRLAKCQLSVPFILPDPFTKQLTIPLWAMRSIIKEWKNKEGEQTHPIVSYGMPIVSCIRFGDSDEGVNLNSKSKSKILNGIISSEVTHEHYFHRDCRGGRYKHVFGDGLVDMSWYLPSGQPTDKFPDAVTFLNLHGDATKHPQQIELHSQVSSICLVQLTSEDLKQKPEVTEILKKLSSAPGGILVLTEKKLQLKDIPNAVQINVKKEESEVCITIQDRIKEKLRHVTKFQNIEDAVRKCVTKMEEEKIIIDENTNCCKRGLRLAEKIASSMKPEKKEDMAEKRKSVLPLQGDELWRAWADKDKELHRQIDRGNKSVKLYSSEIKIKKAKIRKEQARHTKSLSPLMKSFITTLLVLGGDSNRELRNFFLQSLKLKLNDVTRKFASEVQHQYQFERDVLTKLQSEKGSLEKEKAKITEQTEKLNLLQDELINISFGLEHILRELGQVYEAALETRHNAADVSRLPRAAAELLVDGWPLN